MSESTLMTDTHYKAMQGQVNIDEAQGIVECFAAGLGNKDSVGDICVPGCFTESLKRRKPRVVWGHNWNEPIGKVLEIYEVGPNDPRLPLKMKRAGIGGLYAKVQFNLKSERGRQAFADVAFFGEDQEWSIGYKTLNADYDQAKQANILREVELYEVSPVLHGANQLTGTISIKTDGQGAVESVDGKNHMYASNSGENPVSGRAGDLARAIAARMGGAVRLREADQNIAVFDHMEQAGAEPMTMRLAYHFDGDEFMFGEPVKVNAEMVYIPVNNDGAIETAPKRNMFDNVYSDELNQPSVPAAVEGKYPEKADSADMEIKRPNSAQLDTIARASGIREVSSRVPTGSNAIPDVLPQERVTGDVLHGYGPRRGHLERLLRYWRPIMRKEGGFRRCRVILADHPELYPLDNICAWLHHETTGLWPNEGCHHPGMKNCRNKLKRGINGSLWNDKEWESRMSKLPGKSMGDFVGGSPEMMYDDPSVSMSAKDYENMAVDHLKAFVILEPNVVAHISDNSNWEHAGMDDDGMEIAHPMMNMPDMPDMPDMGGDDDCGCGCGGVGTPKPQSPIIAIQNALSGIGKSLDENQEIKAGRVINNRNMDKLNQAVQLLQDVVGSATVEPAVQVKANGEVRVVAPLLQMLAVKNSLESISEYYGFTARIETSGIYLDGDVSQDACAAVINAVDSFKSINR